ncbi:MAG: hypothetical protein FWF49_00670 [Oscillospiraceae bacterium]|nr:hypothetical protein [Oscillospiraceae bacterium]
MEYFHYDNGTVYGFVFGCRMMTNLKTDGSFDWSGSASTGGIRKLKFSNGDYQSIDLATFQSSDGDDGNHYSEVMTINGTQVARDEYTAFCNAWAQRENVEWYALSDENTAACFG